MTVGETPLLKEPTSNSRLHIRRRRHRIRRRIPTSDDRPLLGRIRPLRRTRSGGRRRRPRRYLRPVGRLHCCHFVRHRHDFSCAAERTSNLVKGGREGVSRVSDKVLQGRGAVCSHHFVYQIHCSLLEGKSKPTGASRNNGNSGDVALRNSVAMSFGASERAPRASNSRFGGSF